MAPDRPVRTSAAPTVGEYLSKAPDDLESALAATAPYAKLSAADRLAALASVNGLVDAILGDRMPVRVDGEAPFWRHWADPRLGRPRRAP